MVDPTKDEHDLEPLTAAVNELQDAQAVVTKVTERRNQLIRQAIADGVAVARLAELTGMSLARVYQVRDNRR